MGTQMILTDKNSGFFFPFSDKYYLWKETRFEIFLDFVGHLVLLYRTERRHVSPMFTEYINLQYIHENSICMKYSCIHMKRVTKKVSFVLHNI